ncbi:MAG: class D sortase [Anaerolineales bacterium]
MLVEKRRVARKERLERFRKTGRAVVLAQDTENSLENLRSGPLVEPDEITLDPEPRSNRRKILDILLLMVEIAAVGGFIFILVTGFNLMQDLNQEVASALEQPTLTPTPLIVALVLPSGHTPPNAEGGARPNDAEIPEHLRPLVQSLADIPIPTPSPQQAVRIQIPAINIDAPIVQGDGWEQLKKGVGQHLGTADPGQDGNLVLSAHNDIFGEIFKDLDQLERGDEVTVFTSQRSFTYVIVDTEVVEPTAVEVLEQTKDARVTLISCYPYLVDDQRIVVTARLESSR